MKNFKQFICKFSFLIIILIVFPTMSVISQSIPDSLWSKTLGNDYTDEFTDITLSSNSPNEFVAVGTSESFENYDDIWIVKMDYSGNVLWEKKYGGIGSDVASAIKATSDGGYIICGYSDSYLTTPGNDYNIVLLKIDQNGDSLWWKEFGVNTNEWDFSSDIIVTSDNGFVLSCETHSYGALSRDLYIIKTDSDGNQEWSTVVNEAYLDISNEIQETIDNGYIICGGMGTGVSSQYVPYLVKLNSAGTVVWQKHYSSINNIGIFGEIRSLVVNPDGSYTLLANIRTTDLDDIDDFTLIKVDNMGDTIWVKEYNDPGYDFGFKLKRLANNGYLMIGESFEQNEDYSSIHVMKTDSLGNINWKKNYKLKDDAHNAYSFTFLNDSSIVIVGKINQKNSGYLTDGFIIKLSKIGTSTVINESISDNEILMYPNPSSGIINIDFQSDLVLSIYNSQGVLIEEAKHIKGSSSYDLNGFSKGIYLFVFRDLKGNIFNNKIILQ